MKRSARFFSVLPLIAALALWTAAPAGLSLAQQPGTAGQTLPHYSLSAHIDYEIARVRVDQITRFRNKTGVTLDRAIFHVPTAYFGAFRLAEATAQGSPATASLDGTVLDVRLPAPLEPDGSAELSLSYQLSVPRQSDRFGAGPQAIALGNWFPTLAVHRGDWDHHQYTEVGDAFVTEVADFDVRLTTSVPLVVAASGRVLQDEGTQFHIQALGVRDFALSLSPSYVMAETQAGGAMVRAYTFSLERSRVFAASAAKFLRWYGERFGAFPYRILSVAEVDLPASYGGMEYPGLIFLSSALGAPSPFEGSSTDALIGHETAHQWFYSLVGNDQVQHPWVDEAFAQYLPYYFYKDTNLAIFERLWTAQLAGLDDRIRTAGGLPVDSSIYAFADDGPYFTIVYRQGARFLDEVRRTMGDTVFDSAIRDVLTIFSDKLASPRAVLDVFQRHTSANLNPLISRYFSYGAFGDPALATWRLETPESPWNGSAPVFIAAEFPVTRVEVWLDNQLLYGGNQNALTLNLQGLEPGEYAMLVRVWDHRETQYERGRRVRVSPS